MRCCSVFAGRLFAGCLLGLSSTALPAQPVSSPAPLVSPPAQPLSSPGQLIASPTQPVSLPSQPVSSLT